MEFLSLRGQHFTDACRLAFHMVRLVFGTLLQQLAVEFLQRTYTRQWNTDISSDIAHKVFDQVLLIVGCGIAEHGIKAVMSGKLCVIVLGNSIRPKATLEIGSKLIRSYQGLKYEVEIVANGYLYKNTLYKSLSGVAKAITGKSWNGNVFFGVKK